MPNRIDRQARSNSRQRRNAQRGYSVLEPLSTSTFTGLLFYPETGNPFVDSTDTIWYDNGSPLVDSTYNLYYATGQIFLNASGTVFYANGNEFFDSGGNVFFDNSNLWINEIYEFGPGGYPNYGPLAVWNGDPYGALFPPAVTSIEAMSTAGWASLGLPSTGAIQYNTATNLFYGSTPAGWVPFIQGVSTTGVTSVALSLPSTIFTVSGSPVTSAGTLAGAFNNEASTTVFAGPSSGAAAQPAFVKLTSSYIPALPYLPASTTISTTTKYADGALVVGTTELSLYWPGYQFSSSGGYGYVADYNSTTSTAIMFYPDGSTVFTIGGPITGGGPAVGMYYPDGSLFLGSGILYYPGGGPTGSTGVMADNTPALYYPGGLGETLADSTPNLWNPNGEILSDENGVLYAAGQRIGDGSFVYGPAGFQGKTGSNYFYIITSTTPFISTNSSTTPPASTSTIALPTSLYGSTTLLLGAPKYWLPITVGSYSGRIPVY